MPSKRQPGFEIGLSGDRQSDAYMRAKLARWSMPEPNSNCVLWLGQINADGYGDLIRRRRQILAHRLAWELHHRRSIPAGKLVCHTCDVRSCINPDHLFIGTTQDNTADCVRKRRHTWGDRHPARTQPETRPRGDRHPYVRNPELHVRGEGAGSSKLTVADVLSIRSDTRAQREIASAYGLALSTVSRIRLRLMWAHL